MNRRWKVLWLIKGLEMGGAEKMLTMSLPYLDRDTFDYQVVCLFNHSKDLLPEFERHGIPVSCFYLKKPYDLRVVFKVFQLLRKQEIDILHTHLPYSGIVGRLGALLAGTKIIISTEHGLMESYHPLTRLGNILTLPLNHATIAVSQAAARSVLRYKIIRPEKIQVIYNAIDIASLKHFHPDTESIKKSLGIEGHGLVVGTVSNIRPEKGHQYLLRAARLVLQQRPDVSFVIVGREKNKEDLKRLEELARHLGIRDRIIFTGFREDALQIMKSFDIFVLPSVWEAFALVIMEAMGLGRPVVTTNVGGIPEAIDDGVNGFLVAPRDPQQLATKILYLLNDNVLRDRMGEEGRKKALNKFDIQHMVKEVEQVYTMALNGKNKLRSSECTSVFN
jgi:glycosyltransferase involved in cell wall biosynthesis